MRLREFWHPYHRQLQTLLDHAKRGFGQAILIDCHSMPHEAIAEPTLRNERKPEVVLGDRFGASCSAEVTDRIEAIFSRAGLKVARNSPFAGAYIAQTYGRPSRNQHAIQIEIDRSLYMDERKMQQHRGFDALQTVLIDVIADLVDMGSDYLPIAAE